MFIQFIVQSSIVLVDQCVGQFAKYDININVFLSYIADVAAAAKKSPELIQLLELHAQFAAITPYQVGINQKEHLAEFTTVGYHQLCNSTW